MADGGYPPGVSVQIITREQKLAQAGVLPVENSPGAAPPRDAEQVGAAAAVAVGAAAAVDKPSPSPTPAGGSIQVTGAAALTMARMMGLDEVWNVETGEPFPLADAERTPELAYIDFSALQAAMTEIDREESEKAAAAAAVVQPPFGPPQPQPFDAEAADVARVQQVYAAGPAGPGVVVRFLGPVVRVEVQGPVKLEKRRAGDLRILQIETSKAVEAPIIPAAATRQAVKAPANRAPDPVPAIQRMQPTTPAAEPPAAEPVAELVSAVGELVETVGKPDEF